MTISRRDLALLVAAVFLLVFGTNLQGVLLPIRGHERGASMVAIGLLSSAWSAGFVLACLAAARLIGAVGAASAYLVLAVLSGVAACLFTALPQDGVWIALRFLSGFCFGGASVIVEGRLLASAGGGNFGLYQTSSLIASVAGTLSLAAIDPSGDAPFLLAGGMLALSALPALLAREDAVVRRSDEGVRPDPLGLIRTSPEAAAGCLIGGAVTGAIGGLGPVFGTMMGFGMTGTTLMLAANSIGGAIGTGPVARLAAPLGARRFSLLLAIAGCALSVALATLAGSAGPAATVLLLGAIGLVQYPVYGMSVGRASAEAPGRSTTAIASEALLLFGAGTIVGPLLGARAMRGGASHLFLLVGALFALLLLAAWRPTATPTGTDRDPTGVAFRPSASRATRNSRPVRGA